MRPARRDALGQDLERELAGDDVEVAPVERDYTAAPTDRARDHGRVDQAERHALVALGDRRGAKEVAIAAVELVRPRDEVSEEARRRSRRQEMAELAQDGGRYDVRPRIAVMDGEYGRVMAIACIGQRE